LGAPGEARFADVERRLAMRPKIDVPSIVLYGADDGVGPPPADSPAERAPFTALKGRRVVSGAGHFLPRENPDSVSAALRELLQSAR
jgi:pimeloyl-ACP methyl ester carboxylesterase